MWNFLMNITTKATKIGVDAGTLGSESTPEGIAKAFLGLMQNVVAPVLIVIGALAAIYCIYLGVLYAKAEDANKRKDVQGRLIGAAIGLVIILVGITLCYAINWPGLVTGWTTTK